ncbi:MAG: SCO family protein [Bacteroidota bacterium]
MNHLLKYSLLLACIVMLGACQENAEDTLPYIGNHPNPDAGEYHRVKDFSFINQDSVIVTQEDFAGKAYVVDFFFTSCPTICPKVKQQMLRVYEQFADENQLLFLSHTVDPKYDTPERLKAYAEKLDINTEKWHLVTGTQEELHGISDDYMSIALENADAPGGFDHSGRLILVDADRHIRAFCNGTNPEEVTDFMKDVEKLLNEMDKG